MKKTFKRSLALLLAFVMVLALSAGFFQVSAAAVTLKVGDYVKFGSYNGSPITWRVIDVDKKKGPLLFAEEILSIKAFDASEPVEALPQDYPNYGNNYWGASNMRDWLNSADKKVEWTMNRPDYAFLENGKNVYSDEAGFLSNFTAEERKAIADTKQNFVLDMISKSVATGGSELLKYNPNIKDCMQNYKEAMYETQTDKMFLLNLEQLHDFVYMRGFDVAKRPTEAAVVKSDYKNASLNADSYWKYWLVTPRTEDNTSIRTVYYDNYILDDQAYSGINGVVPATYLKKTANMAAGSGAAADPYVVAGGKATFDDLGSAEWAGEAINSLAADGVVNGVGGTSFAPLNSVSRGDFVLMLMRSLGITGTTKNNFKDVNKGDYYYDAIGQAKIRQYISGYEDGTFHPQAEITMQDMYVIAAKALAANNGVDIKNNPYALEQFKDKGEIAGYAAPAMSWLLDRGVIAGWNGYISPKAVVTRADCAYFIFQLTGELL